LLTLVLEGTLSLGGLDALAGVPPLRQQTVSGMQLIGSWLAHKVPDM
jgi:hypothetical protein